MNKIPVSLFLLFMAFSAICLAADLGADSTTWAATFNQVGPVKIGMTYDELKHAVIYPLTGEDTFIRTNEKDPNEFCGYLSFVRDTHKLPLDIFTTTYTLANGRVANINVLSPKILFFGQIKTGDPAKKIFKVFGKQAKFISNYNMEGGDPNEKGIEVFSDDRKTAIVFDVVSGVIQEISVGDPDWVIDTDRNCQ